MKNIKKESRFDFKGLFGNIFGTTSKEEQSQKDVIMNSADLNSEQKKILMDCLADTEKTAHERFADNIKAVKHLRLNKSGEKPNIKHNPQVINTKKIDELDKEREE